MTTVRAPSGMSTSMPLRLCWRAPRTRMNVPDTMGGPLYAPPGSPRTEGGPHRIGMRAREACACAAEVWARKTVLGSRGAAARGGGPSGRRGQGRADAAPPRARGRDREPITSLAGSDHPAAVPGLRRAAPDTAWAAQLPGGDDRDLGGGAPEARRVQVGIWRGAAPGSTWAANTTQGEMIAVLEAVCRRHTAFRPRSGGGREPPSKTTPSSLRGAAPITKMGARSSSACPR